MDKSLEGAARPHEYGVTPDRASRPQERENTPSRASRPRERENVSKGASRPSKRPRQVSLSSGDSSSSRSESSSSSRSSTYRRHRREGRENDNLDSLSNQVSAILNYIKDQDSKNNNQGCDADSVLSLHPSRELTSSLHSNVPLIKKPRTEKILNCSITTNLKEAAIDSASESRLQILSKLHHFDTKDWERVRYIDTEKKYLARPGFHDLDVNTELRFYDPDSSWLKSLDRSYGALTHAVIQQNEIFKSNLQKVVEWAYKDDTALTPDSLFNKLSEIFSANSQYIKVSEDILQLVCGRRADTIQKRRDSILSSTKDRYVKEDLRNIPPTSTSLFNSEAMSAFLTRAGGTNKLFYNNNYKRSSDEPIMSMRNKSHNNRSKRLRKPATREGDDNDILPVPSTSKNFAYNNNYKNKKIAYNNNKSNAKRRNDKSDHVASGKGARFRK